MSGARPGAAEIARRVAARDVTAEAVTREHLDAHRAARRGPGRVPLRHRRPRPRAGAAHRRRHRRRGHAGAAGRRARRDQGPARHRGDAHDLRLAHPGGLPPALHRHRGGAAGGGGRDRGRQDEHGRVRHGLVHREQRLQGHAQPVGPHARARRILGRLRRGGERGHGRRSRSAPTPADPSASPPRSAASSASSRPTAG